MGDESEEEWRGIDLNEDEVAVPPEVSVDEEMVDSFHEIWQRWGTRFQEGIAYYTKIEDIEGYEDSDDDL